MRTVKIGITLDQDLLAQLDRLVKERRFPSRSRAVQEAIRDKLQRLRQSRLARECAKLDPTFEKALADEGLTEDLERWPEDGEPDFDCNDVPDPRQGRDRDMTTVIDLTEQELAELRELTNQTDVAAALRTIMREYLRYVRRMQLKELSGQVCMQENWAELEKAELKSNHETSGPGAD